MEFDPLNAEHRTIVISAIVAADVLGVGRLTAAREQLEFNGITVTDTKTLESAVLLWGEAI